MAVTASTGPLLERDELLAELRDAHAQSLTGTGRLVLVAGEAGVGKTALVHAYCRDARRQADVLEGACDPLATPRPLGPFEDVAAAVGGELADALTSTSTPAGVLAALRTRFARGPTVLVLEDLHWADEATLDVLRLLARRAEELRALVIVTYRDDELTARHPLLIALGELAAARGVVRLSLNRLSREAVAELAADHPVDATELHARTSGNPFFVTEVLASEGDLLPVSLREAVLARCAKLGGDAQRVVKTVSITPSGAESWLLDRVEIDVGEPLAQALASGVLQAAQNKVTFRHELARQAVESSLTPTEALDLHRRMVGALEADPEPRRDLSRLTHHARAAGDAAAVLRYAPLAAERASSLGAFREAAAHYASALRFADQATVEQRADLLERQSSAFYFMDDQPAAIAALTEAIEHHRRVGDTNRQAAGLSQLVSYLTCRGFMADAGEAVTEAFALLEGSPPSRELGTAYAARALLSAYLGDLEGAIESGSRAMDLATRFDDPTTLVEAAVTVGTARVRRDGIAAREALEGALELAKRHENPPQVARVMHNLAACAIEAHAHDLATHWLDHGVAYCNDYELDLWRLALHAVRVRHEFNRGLWDDAAETASLINAETRDSPDPRFEAQLVVALIRARRGDPGVEPLFAEAAAIAADADQVHWTVRVACARAEIAWITGRSEGIRVATQDALDAAVESGDGWLVGELAYWRRKHEIHDPITSGVASPWSLHLAGDWQTATEEWRARGRPYETALALSEADDDSALREALDVFHELGARPLAAMVTRELRERGVRGLTRGPRRATRESPAGLTQRETEVLRLLAEGLSNSEIAARLFLSGRTVDHHVSAILRKLEVANRRGACAEAARLGIVAV